MWGSYPRWASWSPAAPTRQSASGEQVPVSSSHPVLSFYVRQLSLELSLADQKMWLENIKSTEIILGRKPYRFYTSQKMIFYLLLRYLYVYFHTDCLLSPHPPYAPFKSYFSTFRVHLSFLFIPFSVTSPHLFIFSSIRYRYPSPGYR